jgi:O-glycosyl hydrolase
MGALLRKFMLVSTIALLASASTMAIGIALTASISGGGSLSVDGAQHFQTIDGFGVNVNSASWHNGELRPALDLLVDQLGATIFRVVIDNADWEDPNDNDDAHTFDEPFYTGVYTTPKFEALWSTMAYLNQKGITHNLMLNIMGPVATWMGGSQIHAAIEDEWVEMLASLVYYARTVRGLQFGLLSPMNEPDWDGYEGPQVDQFQYVRLMQKLSQKLDGLGLSAIRLVGPDTASVDAGVQAYFPEMLANATLMAKLSHFGLHNYAGNTAGADEAIKRSAFPTKNFWMTEVSNLWDALPEIAQGATATLVWDAYDSVYNHAILAGRGTTPPNDAGNGPALLAYDAMTGIYTPRKAFYEHVQLFKYVEPGALRIAATASNDALAVVAFQHPQTNRVTIVGRNSGSGDLTIDGSLANLPPIVSLQFSITDVSADAQRLTDIPVSGNTFTLTVSPGATFTLTTASAEPPSPEPPSPEPPMPGCSQTGASALWGRSTSEASGLPGARLTLRGPNSCLDTATTSGSGLYRFVGLGLGSYTLTPEAQGCTFTPTYQTLEITGRFTWVPFHASCP